MDTLAFGYILPTTGQIWDFNPLETCAARRTKVKGAHFVKNRRAFFACRTVCCSMSYDIPAWNAVVVLYAGVLWQYWESKEMQ